MTEARLVLFYHSTGYKEEKHHSEESQVESIDVLFMYLLCIQRCQPRVRCHQ